MFKRGAARNLAEMPRQFLLRSGVWHRPAACQWPLVSGGGTDIESAAHVAWAPSHVTAANSSCASHPRFVNVDRVISIAPIR